MSIVNTGLLCSKMHTQAEFMSVARFYKAKGIELEVAEVYAIEHFDVACIVCNAQGCAEGIKAQRARQAAASASWRDPIGILSNPFLR